MTFKPNDEQAHEGEAASKASSGGGYCKPPVAHRFKKGQSGNPNGRPRKSRSSAEPRGSGLERANKYLLEEAYRPVTIREGDQVIQLPAIQAVFRAMGVSAMKGNRWAQRTLAELVQTIEAEQRHSRLDLFKTAVDYKCNWEERIDRARELGQPEPEPLPHPDDVILDMNGTVSVCGPMTKEQKVYWDMWLDRRDLIQTFVSACAEKYRRARSEDTKAQWLAEWKRLQKLYDENNDDLPKRYRKDFQDRCWESGASRHGQQRKLKWPGEIL